MTPSEREAIYDRAEATILQLMDELPAPIREEAEKIACNLGDFSYTDDHPEALGRYMAWTSGPIIIYVGAIYEAVGGNVDEMCQSIRHVYLHELGHVLGLDETELKDRKL
jgi:predicted Zn-dependent protease with MMP-like domain